MLSAGYARLAACGITCYVVLCFVFMYSRRLQCSLGDGPDDQGEGGETRRRGGDLPPWRGAAIETRNVTKNSGVTANE